MNPRRQGVALALLGVLVLLGTLAHANPPDPTLIGGLWDDADFDDAVVESLSLTEFPPSWLYVSPAVADTETPCSIKLHSPDSRAPPRKLA